MDEQSEYQKLKHSYQGGYQPAKRDYPDFEFIGIILLSLALNGAVALVLLSLYHFFLVPMGAPAIGYVPFFLIYLLLRFIFRKSH